MDKEDIIILASQSPRRRQLLEQAGIIFQVIPSTVKEHITSTKPDDVVVELSQQKAIDVFDTYIKEHKVGDGSIIVIGADTVVAYGERILGKPKTVNEAADMISMLQGNEHQVYTGVTLVKGNGRERRVHSFAECTRVACYPMSRQEIEEYVAGDCCMDKAGGYGIQEPFGMKYVKELSGDYYNVVGLPIARLYHELKTI